MAQVLKILVGTQRITIPSLTAPSVEPFIDQYRQIATSTKKEYAQLQVAHRGPCRPCKPCRPCADPPRGARARAQ
eukprot:7278064-Prymnesium_polylepis.1